MENCQYTEWLITTLTRTYFYLPKCLQRLIYRIHLDDDDDDNSSEVICLKFNSRPDQGRASTYAKITKLSCVKIYEWMYFFY